MNAEKYRKPEDRITRESILNTPLTSYMKPEWGRSSTSGKNQMLLKVDLQICKVLKSGNH